MKDGLTISGTPSSSPIVLTESLLQMVLVPNLGDLLDTLLLLEEIKGPRQQVLRIDPCLHTECRALLINHGHLTLSLVKATREDLFQLLLLVLIDFSWLRVRFDIHLCKGLLH